MTEKFLHFFSLLIIRNIFTDINYLTHATAVPTFQIASKHNLRLGPHSVKAVISRKQRYMKDSNSGNPDGSVSEPRKVVFTTAPEPVVHINSA